jgi:hypothetical protein
MSFDPQFIFSAASLLSAGITILGGAVQAYKSCPKLGAERNAVRKALFENELTPLYLKLTHVHSDYVRMYTNIINATRPFYMGREAESPEAVQAIIASYKDDRDRNLRKRTAIRAKAASLVIASPELGYEVAFLFSIFNYFFRVEHYDAKPKDLARYARRIVKEGYDPVINTPSAGALDRIIRATSLDHITNVISHEIDTLGHYWTAVVMQYTAVKRAADKW